MAHENSSLNYDKKLKLWLLIYRNGNEETMIVDRSLDNMIKLLIHSDL
jgi:hypothetical protein